MLVRKVENTLIEKLTNYDRIVMIEVAVGKISLLIELFNAVFFQQIEQTITASVLGVASVLTFFAVIFWFKIIGRVAVCRKKTFNKPLCLQIFFLYFGKAFLDVRLF